MLIPFERLTNRYGVRPVGVLHIGAHYGQEAEAYTKAGAKKVMWVEANPEVFKILKTNLQKYPDHVAFNHCITDENDQEKTFHVASNEGQSSSILPLGTHARSHPDVKYTHDITVKTKRLDTMLEGHDWEAFPMDFLAMDIQGAELLALRGLGDLIRKFKWVYLEVNKGEVYKGNGTVEQVKSYLVKYGFIPREEKWTKAQWGDCFFVRR